MNYVSLKALRRLASLCLVALLVACQDQSAEIGKPAPPIAVYSLQDQPINLEKGKPTLINFWSEFCGMCLVELRQFAKFDRQYPNRIRVIAINTDGDRGDLAKVLAKEKYPFAVGKDQLKITAGRYKLVGTPTSYFIDANGNVAQKFESIIPESTLEQLFNPTAKP